MKSITFARLSLSIPLLVWVLSTSLVILASALFPEEMSPGESIDLLAVAAVLMLFYDIGILFWFIPYLILAIVLLLLSFRIQVPMLKYLFALSPVFMAILIMLMVALIAYIPSTDPLMDTDLAYTHLETIGISGLFGIVTLIWGYICVGIGFGLYKALQVVGVTKDESISGPDLSMPAVPM
jgi:hypothetical protein